MCYLYNAENGKIELANKDKLIQLLKKIDSNYAQYYKLTYSEIVKDKRTPFKQVDRGIYMWKPSPQIWVCIFLKATIEDFEKYCHKNKLKFKIDYICKVDEENAGIKLYNFLIKEKGVALEKDKNGHTLAVIELETDLDPIEQADAPAEDYARHLSAEDTTIVFKLKIDNNGQGVVSWKGPTKLYIGGGRPGKPGGYFDKAWGQWYPDDGELGEVRSVVVDEQEFDGQSFDVVSDIEETVGVDYITKEAINQYMEELLDLYKDDIIIDVDYDD